MISADISLIMMKDLKRVRIVELKNEEVTENQSR